MEENKPIKETIQRIAFELRESGATEWEVLKIIKELENITTSETQYRKRAAELLEKLNPEAARTFKSFEKMKVYTSAEKREAFDRGNIIKSLLKETSLSRHIAEKIGAEVEDKIKDMKIEQLNTQIIREMVSTKLLEYGHEVGHREYSRIGLPVFEVKKKLEQGFFENKEILKEFNWLFKIPLKTKQLHFDSIINIHYPEDFSTKIFATAKHLKGEREDILLATIEADKYISTPLTITAINYSRAENIKTEKKAQEEAQALEKIFTATGKKRNAQIALFTDYEWEKSGTKTGAMLLAKALMEKTDSKALETSIAIDTKYKLKLLPKRKENINILNYSKEKTTKFGKITICGNTNTILQTTSINTPKIIEISSKEEFWKKLEEILQEIKEMCETKRKELEKRNYIDKKTLEQAENVIALAGLNQTATQIEQNHAKTIEQIITTVQKHGFIACSSPPEDSLQRFGIEEKENELQKKLLQMTQKTRKTFGHTYIAENTKEAETILNDCPSVTIRKTDTV
jgi:hypothetical protein